MSFISLSQSPLDQLRFIEDAGCKRLLRQYCGVMEGKGPHPSPWNMSLLHDLKSKANLLLRARG